jgi:predicted HTH domain antitoxin
LQYQFKKDDMGSDIRVLFPQELAFALKMQEQELVSELQRLSIVKLYELGRLSSGMAAKLLGCSRLSFLEMAGKYQVSILGNPSAEQLQQDFDNA